MSRLPTCAARHIHFQVQLGSDDAGALDQETLKDLDFLVGESGYRSRSEAIQDLIDDVYEKDPDDDGDEEPDDDGSEEDDA